MDTRTEHAARSAAGWMILLAVWLVSLCRVIAAGWWVVNHMADGAVKMGEHVTTATTANP